MLAWQGLQQQWLPWGCSGLYTPCSSCLLLCLPLSFSLTVAVTVYWAIEVVVELLRYESESGVGGEVGAVLVHEVTEEFDVKSGWCHR